MTHKKANTPLNVSDLCSSKKLRNETFSSKIFNMSSNKNMEEGLQTKGKDAPKKEKYATNLSYFRVKKVHTESKDKVASESHEDHLKKLKVFYVAVKEKRKTKK